MELINWAQLENACRKRLRYAVVWNDLDDAVQEAIAFAWREVAEHDAPIGLAIVRACSRVKRGQKFTWEPQGRKERWELEINCQRAYRAPLCDDDYAGRPGLISAQEYRLAQLDPAIAYA